MYFEDANEPLDSDIPVANKIVLGVSIAVILLFFVGLSQVLDSANIAANALMAQL